MWMVLTMTAQPAKGNVQDEKNHEEGNLLFMESGESQENELCHFCEDFSLHSSVSVSESNAGSQHREIPIVVRSLEQGQREGCRGQTDTHTSRFPHRMISRQGAGIALCLLQSPPIFQLLLSPLSFVKPLRNDQYVRLLHTLFQVLILNMLFLQRVDERLFCFNDM